MTSRQIVSIGDPNQHLYFVRAELEHLSPELEYIDMRMPAWIPGSYMVREYARHVQNVRATAPDGSALKVVQQDKACWRIFTQGIDQLSFQYEVYAFDINVRANHLDDTHGFFNGVSLFMTTPQLHDKPVIVEIDCPSTWRAFTGLKPLDDSGRRFIAQDFDELFDCPVELGPHSPINFQVRGVPHQIVFWGQPYLDFDRLVQDTTKIVEANADLFDGQLPYEHYTFIVLLTAGGRGGLEHRNSTVLLWDGLSLRDGGPGSELKEGMPHGQYLNFLRLISHEHFHTWNVKRIRPEVLGPFDYAQENYTRDLWTVEGITSYYEVVNLLNAGLITGQTFLKIFAESEALLREIPGRKLHSLEDASFNAWVKLYRPDENTRNSSVSYYLKGELFAFMLDAYIRGQSRGARSLDDVLKLLWSKHQEDQLGYPEGGYGALIAQATGINVDALITQYARSTDELDWNRELEAAGLKLEATSTANQAPSLGVQTRAEGNRLVISSVSTQGSAYRAGLYANDELVAIDDMRITPDNFASLLKLNGVGSTVELHLFRRGQLISREVHLSDAQSPELRFITHDHINADQRQLLERWLGFAPES